MFTFFERRRTVWDVILGILLILAGIILLLNATIATTLSVLLFGIVVLVGGVVLLVGAFSHFRAPGFFPLLLGAVAMLVLGLFLLRNPSLGAATFTVLVGALLLMSGVVRLFGAALLPVGKWILVVSGLISFLLGLWVLINVNTTSQVFIGVLIGIQVLIEGINLIALGRVRPVEKN